MSEKLRTLSGDTVVKIFLRYGALYKRTTGSHARLALDTDSGTKYITIPLHTELKKGTFHSIAKDFEQWFGNKAMRDEFYSQ
jgi:predicted RNA binding protein YcfA (HicA-like mRNA interferase family)